MYVSEFEVQLPIDEAINLAETMSGSPTGSLKAAIDARFSQDQLVFHAKGEIPFKQFFSGSSEKATFKVIFVQGYRQEGSRWRLCAKVIQKTFAWSKQSNDPGHWSSDINADEEKSFLDVGK